MQEEQNGKSLVNKFFSFSLGPALSALVSFITIPILTWIIIPEEFGKASMFEIALNILILVAFSGMDQSFARFFYQYDFKNRGSLLFQTIKLPFVLLIFIVVILLSNHRMISSFLFGDVKITYIIILSFAITFSIFDRFSLLLIRLKQKGIIYSILFFIKIFLKSGLAILFCFTIEKSFFSIILAHAIAIFISFIASLLIEIKTWKSIFQKKRYAVTNREILKFGVPFTFTFLIMWLFQSMDKLALRWWSNFSEIGIYTSAFKIVGVLIVLQTAFNTFWVPVAYKHYEEKPNDKVFYEKYFLRISFIMFVLSLLLILIKDLITFIFSGDYGLAIYVIPFLTFIPMMDTISFVTVMGINFKKRTYWHTIISVIALSVNFIGNILLVPKYGAKGAAIATGIAYVAIFYGRTIVGYKLYPVCYHFIKSFISILLLNIFAYYSCFYLFGIYHIFIGLIIIIVQLSMYHTELKEIIEFIRKILSNFILKLKR